MSQHTPPGQMAPHIPADLYQRAQATGQPVVFVVNDTPPGIPWRRIALPFAIAGAVVAGGWGLVAAICFLLDAAAHTFTVIAAAAGPIGAGGITLRLARSKNT
ncbi:hypothetical protein [Streptomyces phaeochromogenes]|uniref:hypothetical protein n=1 Tax=Streptomyces phaeochromogenes TaxID=1923 RepID=UPI002DDC1026|nr:hypothetical protein [Streptomyces phaeochromogenes]WRZ30682.1 hypothetical protein OG931_24535 [Streptomyces phaeochromogenes]